jgi:hypothetical protein
MEDSSSSGFQILVGTLLRSLESFDLLAVIPKVEAPSRRMDFVFGQDAYDGPPIVSVQQRDRSPQPSHRQPATAQDVRDLGVDREIARIGLPDLLVPVHRPHRSLVVDLAVLNRMYMSHLQKNLVRAAREIDRDRNFSEARAVRIGTNLEKYGQYPVTILCGPPSLLED